MDASPGMIGARYARRSSLVEKSGALLKQQMTGSAASESYDYCQSRQSDDGFNASSMADSE